MRRRRWPLALLAVAVALAASWWAYATRALPAPPVEEPRERQPLVEALPVGPPRLEPVERPVTPAPPSAQASPDAGVEPARAEEDRDCEIFDGVPPSAEPGDVLVQVVAGTAVNGTLEVVYERPDAGFETMLGGEPMPVIGRRSARVSREQLTLRRCGARRFSVRLLLDDRRADSAENQADGGAVRLSPVATARIRGRLVHAQGVLAGVKIFGGKTDAVTDAEGRFELVFVPDSAELADGELSILFAGDREWGYREVEKVRFRYGPGTDLNLGDLMMKRVPRVSPGGVGLEWMGRDGKPEVHGVTPHSPAALAGMRAGDLVLEIDNVAIRTQDDAMALVNGAPGTRVRLKVQRGAEFLLFDLTRQE